MASTVIQPVADRLKVLLEGLSVPSGPIKVSDSGWMRDQLKGLPAAEIEIPDIDRGEESESQLGSRDWQLDFPVTIYYDLREPTLAQVRIVEAVEKWIAAVDADEQLGGLSGVVTARVIRADRVYELQDKRTLIGYETTVRVTRLV